MNSNTTNLTSAEIESQLKYYTGTTRYYRFSSFHPYTFLTDGALEAQKLLECNWLFLHIASRQEHYKIKNCQMLQQYTKEFRYNLKLAAPVMMGMLGHTFVGLIDNIMEVVYDWLRL